MKLYGHLFGVDRGNKAKVIRSVREMLQESGYAGINIYLCGSRLCIVAVDLQPERYETITEITNHPQQPDQLFVFYKGRSAA